MATFNRIKGNFVETYAAAYLRRKGYRLLTRNYAYRGGELDIVAQDENDNAIVFVEVKSVWNNRQGNPASRVNYKKQQQIWQTACPFLYGHGGFEQKCRFDVLSVRTYQTPPTFTHIQNAFEGKQVIPQV